MAAIGKDARIGVEIDIPVVDIIRRVDHRSHDLVQTADLTESDHVSARRRLCIYELLAQNLLREAGQSASRSADDVAAGKVNVQTLHLNVALSLARRSACPLSCMLAAGLGRIARLAAFDGIVERI